MHGERWLSW